MSDAPTPKMIEAVRVGCGVDGMRCSYPACVHRVLPRAIIAAVKFALTDATKSFQEFVEELRHD